MDQKWRPSSQRSLFLDTPEAMYTGVVDGDTIDIHEARYRHPEKLGISRLPVTRRSVIHSTTFRPRFMDTTVELMVDHLPIRLVPPLLTHKDERVRQAALRRLEKKE